MKLSVLSVAFAILSLTGLVIGQYRDFEIQIVLNLFKIFREATAASPNITGNLVLTHEELTEAFLVRFEKITQVTPTNRIKYKEQIGVLFGAGSRLNESPEVIKFYTENNLSRISGDKGMNAWDLVKIFDPASSSQFLDGELEAFRTLLLCMVYAWMERSGDGAVSCNEFITFFDEQLESVSKNDLKIIFESSTDPNVSFGNLPFDDWHSHCQRYKTLISILTLEQIYPYSKDEISRGIKFFNALDKDGKKAGDGGLSAIEARDKHIQRCSINHVGVSNLLGAGFQSWVESIINASRNSGIVETAAVKTCIENKTLVGVNTKTDQINVVHFAKILDPRNYHLLKKYNVQRNFWRLFFVWMDANRSWDVSVPELIKFFKETLHVGVANTILAAIFGTAQNINIYQWEAHCAGYRNLASVLMQRTVMAG